MTQIRFMFGFFHGRAVLAAGAVVIVAVFAAATASHATVIPVTKTTNTNDGFCDSDCSLREAIVAANNNPGTDSITLPAGTFTLTIAGAGEDSCATGDLDLKGASVSITGQGPLASVIDATGLVTGSSTSQSQPTQLSTWRH